MSKNVSDDSSIYFFPVSIHDGCYYFISFLRFLQIYVDSLSRLLLHKTLRNAFLKTLGPNPENYILSTYIIYIVN